MYGNETHGVMTLHKNKNRYNAKTNFNFSVNDMLNKTMQSSILILQLRNKLQSFIKCAKIMIQFQRQKYQPMQNAYFFVFSMYLKRKCMD
jgi:hypothetical protein